MSDEEISESEIIELLGTYADALQDQATIAPQHEPRDEIEIVETDGGVQHEGGIIDDQEDFNEGSEVVELGAISTSVAEPRRGRLLVAAACVAVVAVVGAVFVINQDRTALDTALVADSAEDEQQDLVDEDEAAAVVVPSPDDPSNTAQVAATSAEADLGFTGFGTSNTVFTDDGEFVSLGSGPNGVAVSRSTNGTEWETQSVNGLPDNAMATGLVEVEGRWVTVVEVWPEIDEDADGFGDLFFLDGSDVERVIGVSNDLVNWTTSDFPDLGVEEGDFAFILDIASSGDRVAIVVQVQEQGNDEMRILFDAGLLSAEDLENFCGLDPLDDDTYIAFNCGLSEDVGVIGETDESAAPTTTISGEAEAELFDQGEFGQEELLRIERGDPGFEEIEALYNSPSAFDPPTSLVISGPVEGPFEIVDVPLGGVVGAVAGTSNGFVITSSDFATGSSSASSSIDGVTWAEPSVISSDSVNVTDATTSGDRVAVVGQSNGGEAVSVFISDDLGTTWAQSTIPSELFGAFGDIAAGPAGFAVALTGPPTEAFDGAFGDVDVISIASDGYTMTISLAVTDSGGSSLIGPDGIVIHDSIPESELFAGDGIENVARFEGPDQETIIWLDPTTGEDLVSFDQTQFDEAFDQLLPDFDEQALLDQSMSSEIWFSPDGTTWALLDPGEFFTDDPGRFDFTFVAAVGDNEVLLSTQQNSEPPEELLAYEAEGRDPTPAEDEALSEWLLEQAAISVWTAIPVGG